MQITDAEQPLGRPRSRAEILSAAAWYDPDSVTFVGAADDRAETMADEPVQRDAEPDRVPMLERA